LCAQTNGVNNNFTKSGEVVILCLQHFMVFVATELENISLGTGITTHPFFDLGSPEHPSAFALFRQANADAAKARAGSVYHNTRAALASASQDTQIAAVLNTHLGQLSRLATFDPCVPVSFGKA